MSVAARGVDVLLPTPTLSRTALVANEPDRLLANAYEDLNSGMRYATACVSRVQIQANKYLHSIPYLIFQIIGTD